MAHRFDIQGGVGTDKQRCNTPDSTGDESASAGVSLIVCSRGRQPLLRDTIGSIRTGEYLPDEIIVIDQSGSPDQSLAALEIPHCSLRYRWSPGRGLSRALNEGMAAARYQLLAFTHDDVTVEPDWLGALIAALREAGPNVVVTGRVRPEPIATPGGFVPSTKDDPTPAVYRGRLDLDPLFPMNMAFYRSTLARVGGFDERLGPGTPFPGAEDNDFGYRLLLAGFRIDYVPAAALTHRAWRSGAGYLPLRWGYGRAQGAFYGKYARRGDQHILGRLGRALLRYPYQAVCHMRREPRVAAGNILYIIGMLSAAIEWNWRTRSRDARYGEGVTH